MALEEEVAPCSCWIGDTVDAVWLGRRTVIVAALRCCAARTGGGGQKWG